MSELVHRARAALAPQYTVVDLIGEGGMACVFLAEDHKHQRRVAVKILRPDVGAALGAARFQHEIQLAARLSHPHILTLIDSGEADGLLFYVMPYVEGDSLRVRLDREGRLGIGESIEIGRAIAGALEYAHTNGVVHRDIKPENILMHGGIPVVTDFGIAKALGESGGDRLTATGVAVGTPAYMSPEQVSGDHDVDGRSDIYSLGCVLYEMITGAPPFAGSTVQAVMLKRFAEPAPRVSERRGGVPHELNELIAKAMAHEPAGRFATGEQLAQAFTHALARTHASSPSLSPAAVTERTVAVLPFTNNSSDPENEYFSDGITEEVINALGRVEGLRVTARTSAFAFKGASRDIRDIGRALNVGAILEGSVRKSGNRLRISAQLIDVHGGVLLWSERYDRDLEDIFVVQDEIATIIAGCLQAKLSPPASRPGSAQSLAAYDAYLRGRFYWNKGTSESCRTSVEHFERAIAIDKGYARAYAGIAEALVYSALLGASAAETFPRARTFAQQAIALDPSLADAHATLAYIQFWFDWQWDEADRGFRRAIKLNPNSAAAHNYYSVFLANLGRTDEAIAQSQLTLELDPLWVNAHQSYGWALLVGERYADSVKASDGALELAPEYVLAYASKGMALLEMGSAGDALATFERVREPDDPFRLAGLACCSARSGRLSDARELVDRMVQLAEQGKMLPSWVTLGYCALGDVDQAFHWLERGIRLRDPFVVCMPSFVWYDPMRADPRFDQLLESLNFPPASLTRAAIRRQRTGVPEAPSGYNLTV